MPQMGNKRPAAHICVAGWLQGIASLALITGRISEMGQKQAGTASEGCISLFYSIIVLH